MYELLYKENSRNLFFITGFSCSFIFGFGTSRVELIVKKERTRITDHVEFFLRYEYSMHIFVIRTPKYLYNPFIAHFLLFFSPHGILPTDSNNTTDSAIPDYIPKRSLS